jgi:DNA-binding NarL/FixJ family response regulator
LSTLRVALVTGSATLRLYLRTLIDELPHAQYAFTAHSVDDLRGFRPPADIYLLDADTVGGPDNAWLSELLPAQAGLVWLLPTGSQGQWPAVAAGERGTAFLSSELDVTDLGAALEAVAAGLQVWDPRLENETPEAASNSTIHLTTRESEVLDHLAGGWGNEAIADALDLSVNTVKFHLKSLYDKLGVSNRTQAIREAARHGLLVL